MRLFGNSEWVTNRGCESGQDGPKESLSAASYRQTSALETPSAIFQTVSLVLQRHFRLVEELAASSLAPERFLYLLPEAFFAPPVVTVVDRLPRPELLLWQVSPRSTAGVDPEHPIDHPTVIPPLPATASVWRH